MSSRFLHKNVWQRFLLTVLCTSYIVASEEKKEEEPKKDEVPLSLRRYCHNRGYNYVNIPAKPKFTYGSKDYQWAISGYVKSDNFVDSRQMVGIHEDQVSLFPAPDDPDRCGRDLNAQGESHMLAIQTRVRGTMVGPIVDCARVSGLIEGEFTGPWILDNGRAFVLFADEQFEVFPSDFVNAFRLRHAYIQFDWDEYSFLAGQFWHPLVPPESATHSTVTYTTAPFEPIAFAPQLRLTRCFGDYADFIGAILMQTNFKSNGPIGFSTKYIRDSILPNLHAQGRFYWQDNVFGIAVDFKRLKPRLQTEKDDNLFKTRQTVGSWSGLTYAHFDFNPFECGINLMYAENMTDEFMIVGYGVKNRDECTNEETYTPIRGFAGIFDCVWNCGELRPGLVVGYTKNLGSKSDLFIDPTQEGNQRFTIFGLGGGDTSPVLNTVDYVLGVMPRIEWWRDPVLVGGEIEFLRAAYGDIQRDGKINNATPVNNVRFTFAVYYYF